jgi:hypothetical protein
MSRMEDFEEIEVRRFAIDKGTTSLLVEYNTRRGKKFVRRIRFKKYKPDCDPKKVAAKLMKQFMDILGKDKVNEDQVLELVELLLSKKDSHVNGGSIPARRTENTAPMDTGVNVFGDLNKVSEEENMRAKAIMEEDFKKNAKKPGDDGYIHDKRVEFEASEENDWDLDSFDDEDDEADI